MSSQVSVEAEDSPWTSPGVRGILTAADIAQLVLSVAALAFLGTTTVFLIRARHLKFNLLWKVRLGFTLTCALWVLASFLNNAFLFNPYSGRANVSLQDTTELCLGHVVVSYGVTEPAFYTFITLLLRFRTTSLRPEASHHRRIFGWVFVLAFPHLALHIAIVVLNVAFANAPHFVFLAYNPTLQVCSVPLISIIAISAAIFIFFMSFNFYGHRLGVTLLNRRLRKRIKTLRVLLTATSLLGLLARWVILFYEIGAFLEVLPDGDSGLVVVELLRQIYSFTFFLAVCYANHCLVFRPCLDAATQPFVQEDPDRMAAMSSTGAAASARRDGTVLYPRRNIFAVLANAIRFKQGHKGTYRGVELQTLGDGPLVESVVEDGVVRFADAIDWHLESDSDDDDAASASRRDGDEDESSSDIPLDIAGTSRGRPSSRGIRQRFDGASSLFGQSDHSSSTAGSRRRDASPAASGDGHSAIDIIIEDDEDEDDENEDDNVAMVADNRPRVRSRASSSRFG